MVLKGPCFYWTGNDFGKADITTFYLQYNFWHNFLKYVCFLCAMGTWQHIDLSYNYMSKDPVQNSWQWDSLEA